MGRSQRSKVEIHGTLYGSPDGASWGIGEGDIDPPPVELTLSGIAPATAEVGAPDVTVTLTGTGFNASCSVLLDGLAIAPPIVTDVTSMTAIIPASSMAAAAALAVTVSDGTATTDPSTFTVTAPSAPEMALTSIVPTTLPAGSPDWAMQAHGTGFTNGDTIYVDETSLTSVFTSDLQLSGTIPAALMAAPTTLAITVRRGEESTTPISLPITGAAGDTTKAKKRR